MQRDREIVAFWSKMDKRGDGYFSGYIKKEDLEKMLQGCDGDKVSLVLFFNKFWRKKNNRPKLLGFVTKEKK